MTEPGGGVKSDSQGLRGMAEALRSSTQGVQGLAHDKPPMPEVTISSEKLGYTVSEILKAMAGLGTNVEQVAGKIDVTDGSYAETDNHAEQRFNQQETRHLK